MKRKPPTKQELIEALDDIIKACDTLIGKWYIVQPFINVAKKHSKVMSWIYNRREKLSGFKKNAK